MAEERKVLSHSAEQIDESVEKVLDGTFATKQDVTQLKQDVAAITPDDTAIDGKPWTSKKIVDTLCQPFEESGNPVQCYPVEAYPLGVKVSWEPVQEGNGDPSPENIRPITGMDTVSVTRCGKNLVCSKYDPGYTETKDGLTFTVNDDYSVSVSGTATIETYFNFKAIKHKTINTIINAMDKTVKINGYTARDLAVQTHPNGYTALYLVITKGQTVDRTYYPILVYGDEIAYEPYRGNTYDIALPETVYGGTLDMETGVVTVDTSCETLTSTSPTGKAFYYEVSSFRAQFSNKMVERTIVSTHYTSSWKTTGATYRINNVNSNDDTGVNVYIVDPRFTTETELKAWFDEQYAAGTPVQISYKLANPYTIQLTPQQITALSGVNTIYTNADGVIVSGAEDPKHTITELKNAIISLGGNV